MTVFLDVFTKSQERLMMYHGPAEGCPPIPRVGDLLDFSGEGYEVEKVEYVMTEVGGERLHIVLHTTKSNHMRHSLKWNVR